MATVRATARGHDAITATHRKTLEITRDAEIGRNASCVVGVSGVLDEDAFARLRGTVELTIAAGGHRAVLRGRVNPAFCVGDPLIVRRDPAVTRNAMLVDADLGAAGLGRDLVAALAQPDALIELTFAEVATARAAAGVLIVDVSKPWTQTPACQPTPADAAAIADALERGERVELLTDLLDPAGAAIVRATQDAGATVLPRPGLPPLTAALAVAGVPLTVVELRRHASRMPIDLVSGTTRVITGVPGDRVLDHLTCGQMGLVAADVGTSREEFLSWRHGTDLALGGGRARTALVVTHRPPEKDDAALDPTSRAHALALLAEDVPVNQIARALTTVTGRRRREIYDAVVALKEGG